VFGITEGSVRARVSKAKARLARLLGANPSAGREAVTVLEDR
jgi:hypothetical protein